MILNNKYFLDDIESGEWYEVSKEEHDAHLARIKSATEAAIKLGYKGVIYLAGTFDERPNSDFEKLWKSKL